jgi:hypothetical protein
MNCCGSKRQALQSSSFTSVPGRHGVPAQQSNAVVTNAPPSTAKFRYTGDTSLHVEGRFNRRVYKFSRESPELAVLAEDAAILRGYFDLVELRG